MVKLLHCSWVVCPPDRIAFGFFKHPYILHLVVTRKKWIPPFTDLWIAVYEEVFSCTDIDHVQICYDSVKSCYFSKKF